MELIFLEYLEELVAPLLNPQKRIFFGYLGSALLIGLCVQWRIGSKRFASVLREVFAPKIWWSKSSRLDYKIILVNRIFILGVVPQLATKLTIAIFTFEVMHIWLDGRVLISHGMPSWVIGTMFTTVLFLAEDWSKYIVHRWLHTWPVLWCFHKVHHSAETLTPFTVYRTHPIEGLIFTLRSIVIQGITVAAFFYFFGEGVELLTLLGANIFLLAFNTAGSNLRHSHVWLSYGRNIERLIISPAQHQIHHSKDEEHHNRNFGAVLAIWDLFGNSLTVASQKRTFQFGLMGKSQFHHDLIAAYLVPFGEAFNQFDKFITLGLLRMFKHNVPHLLGIFSVKCGFSIGLLLLGLLATTAAISKELNIYSHRQPFLIEPFIKAYTQKTGIKINIVYASKGLAQRLQAEGVRSPADIILTVDIGRLHIYADKNLLSSIKSKILRRNIPAHLRDPKNRWFAFSKRARVIVVSAKASDVQSIKRYEDLADPRWHNRLCLRPGSHVYNRALVASLINASGEEAAEDWALGMMKNLSRRPQGNDRAQVKAIYEGVCDIAIINNYYFGKLRYSVKPQHQDWASAVTLIFPNQEDRGAHVNISGGGVARHSKNKVEAIRFLEFLTSRLAQNLYGSINFEYPVNPKVPPSAELSSWGSFQEDSVPIARIAELAPTAQRVIDRVGW